MTPKKLWTIIVLLLSLMIAAGAQAAVVGRFTAVEGQVEILKQGKIPATAARVNDGVEPGDVIRTKTKAKAQVKFVDDSQVTLAPESRMAVADYTYDADKGERRAVLRFFKGVIHTVVTRLLKTQEPDFLMGTHTAVMGVRGTETYTVLLPNATGAYLIDGLLELRSNNRQVQGVQLLKRMEFSTISLGQPPRMPKPISPAMLEMLKNLMNTGLKETAFLGVGAEPRGPGLLQIPEVLGFTGQENLMQPFIPPRVVPPVVTPAPTPTPARGGGSPTGPSVP
jgi:hypothetical protein